MAYGAVIENPSSEVTERRLDVPQSLGLCLNETVNMVQLLRGVFGIYLGCPRVPMSSIFICFPFQFFSFIIFIHNARR